MNCNLFVDEEFQFDAVADQEVDVAFGNVTVQGKAGGNPNAVKLSFTGTAFWALE
jgi:hypothetical protein